MLTTIYLFGELGHRFGRKWKLDVASPAEAIRAIEANRPGLADYLASAGDRGVDFKVKVDGEAIGPERLSFKRRGAVIRISPVPHGAKNSTAMIIIGAVLVVASYGAAAGWFGGAAATATAAGTGIKGAATGLMFGAGSVSYATFVGGLGLSMAIGGIAQALAPQPGQAKYDPGKPSYLFSGPVNSAQQGGPVPLCYGGPIIVGGQIVSAGIYSDDISAVQRGTVEEGPFTADPDYPDYTAPVTPTNLKGRSLQTKQNARFLIALCEGKIAGLCDAAGNILSYDDRNKGILFESTQTVRDDGTAAFNEFSTAFRAGSATQEPIPGFPAAESETSVEVEVIKGSDKIANAVTRTISAGSHNAIRVSIRIPALYSVDAKGNRGGAAVHFGIHIKRSADSTWTEVVGSNALPNGELDGLIQGEATEATVWPFRIPLPGVGPWDVRVLKENADAADPTSEQSRCVWASYALLTDGKFTYRHTAMLAADLPADKFPSAPQIWSRIKGKLVRIPSNYNPVTRNYSGTWDGKFAGADLTLTADYTAGGATLAVSALAADLPVDSPIEITQGGITSHAYLLAAASSGATSLSITPINRAFTSGATGYGFDLKWTNCPPWILYDLAVEKRYGLGDYIKKEHLDRWALYTIARYCDGVDGSGNFVGVDDGRGGVEPRFTITTYIQGAEDAYRILSDMAAAFRGMIFYGAGVISAVQDAPKDPRFNFHDGNVIEGEFQYSNTAVKARHTRVRVQFADPDNFFKPDIETVDADDATIDVKGVRPISVAPFGCASRGLARRIGKYILTTEELEKETVSFRTGMQGARARPGDVVRVRDRFKTTNVMAGRILSVGSGTLTLDAPVTLGAGSYSIIVTKSDGTFADLPVTTGVGTTATLAVTGSLTGIVAFTDWVLRTSTLEPVLFRVLNVREIERHIFELTGLRYAAEKFAAVESGIVIPAAPTSDLPPPEAPDSPASVTIEESAVDTASGTQRFLTCTWEASTSRFVDGYLVEYRSPGGEWREVEHRAKGTSAKPVLVSALGEHSFRVFAVNTLGFVSTPPAALSYTLAEVDIPDAPSALAAEAQTDGIFLTWVNPESPNLTVIEVQESLDGTFTDPPAAPSPVIGTAPADTEVAGSFHRGGITANRHRWYRIRAVNKSGGRSPWHGPVDATAIAAPAGAAGAGLVYVGTYNGANTYYKTAERIDVVLHSGNYYPAANAAKSGLATWGAPGGADWGAAFTNFKAVATDLLLANDATILKTLVMGDGVTANAGLIRSAGATAFATGAGFWLGYDGTTTKFRVGNPAGTYLSYDGAALTIQAGGASSPLIVDTDATWVGAGAAPGRLRLGASFTLYSNSAGTASGMTFTNGQINFTLTNHFAIGSNFAWYDGSLGGAALNYGIDTVNAEARFNRLGVSDGGSGDLAFRFRLDTDTGIYRFGSGDMRFVMDGTTALVMQAGQVVCLVPLKLDNNFAAGAPTATGYLTVRDAAGATYKLLCAP